MQSFSDFYNKMCLNEGENSSFKNLYKKTTPKEQKTMDKAKDTETKQENVQQENQIVTQLKKKIDILFKNYGEMGLRMVDEAIIKSHEKLKKILSNMDSSDMTVEVPEQEAPKAKVVKKVKLKKKVKPVVQKKVVVVKKQEVDEDEVMSDNEDQNTSTNKVNNSLPDVFPSNNNNFDNNEDDEEVEVIDDEEDSEDEEEVIEEPKKKKSEKNESKKIKQMSDDEISDMLYEKSLEYTMEHTQVETFDDIPDFLGDENEIPLNENNTQITQAPVIPRVDIDNITGDAMDDFADQFC